MTLPSPILSSVFSDGELTTENKWYTRIFSVINSIISWGDTIAQFIGVGSAAIGTPPAYTTGLFRMQAGSAVLTYATGGVTLGLPTAFGTGVLSAVLTPGDASGSVSQLQILNGSTTASQIKFAAFQPGGAQVANGGLIRVNYMVIGW